MLSKSTIEQALNATVTDYNPNGGWLQTVSGDCYYLKTGTPGVTYSCEARGLQLLREAGEIDVATAVAWGDNFIVTTYIRPGTSLPDFFADFGTRLARLHRHSSPSFGLDYDNCIGAGFQPNGAGDGRQTCWTEFCWIYRLLFQFELAQRNGLVDTSIQRHFARLENLLPHILSPAEHEPPALIHGDLWRGNYLCQHNGSPALIDPAVYYAHREAELAMPVLFGGFPQQFFDAYHHEYPLVAGWQDRVKVYMLYHLLNHLNIFGGGYQTEVKSLLSEIVCQ